MTYFSLRLACSKTRGELRHCRRGLVRKAQLVRGATISLMLLAAVVSGGCRNFGYPVKRDAEECCPTDIRQTVPWCAGEDAVFQCPCQPDAAFYGYKPTCWSTWPAPGAAWRDAHCGSVHHGAIITDLTNSNPELIMLPKVQPELAPPPPPPPADAELPQVDEKQPGPTLGPTPKPTFVPYPG